MIDEPTAATPAPADGPAATETSGDDRTLAMLCHLLGIFTSFIGAVIWLVQREKSPFVDDQGKEAPNFQITMILAQIVAGITVTIGIGCILLPAILVLNLVFCILGAMEASKGVAYRYPFALRLVN